MNSKIKIRRIGIVTAGGDCPGLNAVIRAIVKTAIYRYGLEVVGFQDGYSGVILNKARILESQDASGILHRGGTILGTSNRDNPFRFPAVVRGKIFLRMYPIRPLKILKRIKSMFFLSWGETVP